MILMYVSVAVLMNCAYWKAGLAVLTGTVHIPFSLCMILMYMCITCTVYSYYDGRHFRAMSRFCSLAFHWTRCLSP